MTEQDIDATRARLLAAMAKLVAESGYAAFSMRQLAREVGLTAGALYRYFPTKHALLIAYWSESIGALHAHLSKIAGDVTDPRDRLLQMANAYVAFALQDRPRFRTMFLESDHGELGEFGRSTTLLAPFFIVRDQVAVAIEAGVLKRMAPDLAAQVLWASVHGVLTLAENIDPMDFGDVAALADLAARTALAGLSQPERPE